LRTAIAGGPIWTGTQCAHTASDMNTKGVVLGFMLSALASVPLFSAELKASAQPVSQTGRGDSISELRNQDEAFTLLIEAFRMIQGRIIQNDYEARIRAASALSDVRTQHEVAELAKEERDLRAEKLSRQIGNLDVAYGSARRDDERVLAVADVPPHIDTKHAAKTLMDFVFVAPTAPDKNGDIKATTVPAKDYLLDKPPEPVE